MRYLFCFIGLVVGGASALAEKAETPFSYHAQKAWAAKAALDKAKQAAVDLTGVDPTTVSLRELKEMTEVPEEAMGGPKLRNALLGIARKVERPSPPTLDSLLEKSAFLAPGELRPGQRVDYVSKAAGQNKRAPTLSFVMNPDNKSRVGNYGSDFMKAYRNRALASESVRAGVSFLSNLGALVSTSGSSPKAGFEKLANGYVPQVSVLLDASGALEEKYREQCEKFYTEKLPYLVALATEKILFEKRPADAKRLAAFLAVQADAPALFDMMDAASGNPNAGYERNAEARRGFAEIRGNIASRMPEFGGLVAESCLKGVEAALHGNLAAAHEQMEKLSAGKGIKADYAVGLALKPETAAAFRPQTELEHQKERAPLGYYSVPLKGGEQGAITLGTFSVDSDALCAQRLAYASSQNQPGELSRDEFEKVVSECRAVDLSCK